MFHGFYDHSTITITWHEANKHYTIIVGHCSVKNTCTLLCDSLTLLLMTFVTFREHISQRKWLHVRHLWNIEQCFAKFLKDRLSYSSSRHQTTRTHLYFITRLLNWDTSDAAAADAVVLSSCSRRCTSGYWFSPAPASRCLAHSAYKKLLHFTSP